MADVVDQFMCSETCPCYTDTLNDSIVDSERSDALIRYNNLPQSNYDLHKRYFSYERKDKQETSGNWTVFEWSTDKT